MLNWSQQYTTLEFTQHYTVLNLIQHTNNFKFHNNFTNSCTRSIRTYLHRKIFRYKRPRQYYHRFIGLVCAMTSLFSASVLLRRDIKHFDFNPTCVISLVTHKLLRFFSSKIFLRLSKCHLNFENLFSIFGDKGTMNNAPQWGHVMEISQWGICDAFIIQ